MENLKKLIDFIKDLSLPGKIISIVVILLTLIVSIFFSSCASRIHFDRADNFTHEVNIYGK